MKKLSLLLLLLPLFVACSDDKSEDIIVHDFFPVIVQFEVVDADGASLIDTDAPLYGADFHINYNDKVYDADWEVPTYGRLYLPAFDGLNFAPSVKDQGPWLTFGEFNGQRSQAEFSFFLPDGSSHQISFSRNIDVDGMDTHVTQTVTFDGREVEEYRNADSPILNFKIVCDL